ncbi:hypothetical protein F5878DRAFT_637368 [Lentinula raphanica]|uniref:Uncharacterized protein n=1 Tax=Lentinula raphanica TaxID=153919 RepID=A0AA38PL24_9AGAR|nr:hypothetical protein F5878DRAFT_637368 [Lentinula raphanica]
MTDFGRALITSAAGADRSRATSLQPPAMPTYNHENFFTLSFDISLASHQFQRICLQLLFNHVKVRRVGELRKLQGQCLLNDTFAACIRTLDITDMFGFEADYELLSQILPHLCNLLCLLMLDQIHATSKLFQAIQCHPSATIAISSFWNLPQGLSDHSDLWKIIVRALHIYGNEGYSSNYYFDQLRDCGMQIKWVAIDQPGFLKEPFGMIRFSGLVELQLRMKSSPVDFASFNEFSCAHPHLQKICFADFDHSYFREQSNLMFMEPFLDVLARDGLAAATRIRGFAVTRNTSISNALSHWNVTSLFLTIAESSEQVLQLASLLYPEISILTIVHAPCTVIEFGIDEPWQDPSIVEAYEGPMIGPVATEFAMNWCISRIATVVPSIEAFYIKEEGYDGPNLTGRSHRATLFLSISLHSQGIQVGVQAQDRLQ